jgi:hypothetical protein
MPTTLRTTDAKGRLTLPKAFANATVVIEQLSETEIRIRKAKVIPEDELPFAEETRPALSDADRDLVLSLLDNPPRANAKLTRAAERFKKKYGGNVVD